MQIGKQTILEVTYTTHEIESHDDQNFGCWYLTDFTPPAGYSIIGQRFMTVTDGTCQMDDKLNVSAVDAGHFVTTPFPNGGEKGSDAGKNSQDYEECITYKRTPQYLQFKYRMRGYETKGWQFYFKSIKENPGWAFVGEETDYKNRRIGYARMTIYYLQDLGTSTGKP